MKIAFNKGEPIEVRSIRVEHGYVYHCGESYKLIRTDIEAGEVVYYVEGERRLEERQPWCLW